MNHSLFEMPVSAVVAACLACSLSSAATCELTELANQPSAEQPTNHHLHAMQAANDRPSTRSFVESRQASDGTRTRVRVETDASARFELQMDLTIDGTPRYREPVEALAPDDGPYAMLGAGTLRIASTADASLAGGSVRIRNTDTRQEMIYLLALDEDLLEVTLDPGTYDILIEGFIADDPENQDFNRRLGAQPAPASIVVLGGLFGALRRRRR